MINIKNYPYNNQTKSLGKAITILNKNGKCGYEVFDFPDYAGLPKSISFRLTPEEVDFIQENWDRVRR